MNMFKSGKRTILMIVLMISLFVVFFVWTSGKDGFSLSFDGITKFRRGLDVSGGTKLTYKIDFSKYDEIYGNQTELNAAKTNAQNIIFQNIDGRISSLGVSDYNAYPQQRNDETQIVVELGGITDMNQAKEIIGKTVELEFKLPNPEVSNKEERKTYANKIYQDVKNAPEKMKEFENKGSENVFYTTYDHKTLLELPSVYSDHIELLENTKEGEVSQFIEGKYGDQKYYNESGALETQEINGYTFIKLSKKETNTREKITLQDIVEVASKLGLHIEESLDIAGTDRGIASGSYVIANNQLQFNQGPIYNNEEAYTVRILQYIPEDLSSLTGAEYEAAAKKINDKKEFVTKELENDPKAEFSEVSLVYENTMSLTEIKKYFPSFVNQEKKTAKAYEQEGVIYFIYVSDKKAVNDQWYGFVIINDVDASAFEKEIKSETYYTFEEIFVQDQLTWVPALSSKGQSLDGKDFQYAETSISQLGEHVVAIHFNSIGKEVFCDITKHNLKKELAIFIGGKKITSPVIQAEICDGTAQIDGNFTKDSAKIMATELNEWALPAPLILIQEEKVAPSLWENAFMGAVIALVFGIVAIFVYMTVLYGIKKGLVTLCSIVSYTVVLLAVVKITGYALSLSGIAAIILSIGMAVDANVLIFERMKEEEENNGKSEAAAINVAYERSFAAIKDSQISTGIIGLFLFFIGINMFKGFGAMLVVGVLLTLLINVPLIKIYLTKILGVKEETTTKKKK